MTPTLTVSRRSYLLSRPSDRIMRAAGHAASSAALQAIARKRAEKQFAELTGAGAGDIVIGR